MASTREPPAKLMPGVELLEFSTPLFVSLSLFRATFVSSE